MAKQVNGYLGGFIGKLGPAVGYRWKRTWCMRSLPRRIHNPRTEAQQEHRTMFREEVRLAGRMSRAVTIGLKAPCDELSMTPQNLFVKANQQAFSMVDGVFSVNYAALRVSAGPVAPVEVTEVSVDNDNVLNISFDKNPLRMSCSAYDNVFFWVWCPAVGEGYLASPVHRRTKHASVLLPQVMEGCEVHVYAFVRDDRNLCSDTSYGTITDNSEDHSNNNEPNELENRPADQLQTNCPPSAENFFPANRENASPDLSVGWTT